MKNVPFSFVGQEFRGQSPLKDCKGRAFTQGVGVRLLIKDNAKEGIKKKLAHYNEVARENNTSQRKRNDRDEVRYRLIKDYMSSFFIIDLSKRK